MNAGPGPSPAFLDRSRQKPLVGSYSLLNQYLNCPHATFHKYIGKTIPFVETPEMAWGNRVHKAFEDRVSKRIPLPDDMAHWEQFAAPFDPMWKPGHAQVELKCAINIKGESTGFFSDDAWFRGKLDLSLVNNTKAYLVDYKTGNPSYEDPFELEIGAVLLDARLSPKLRAIAGQYIWLKESRLGKMYDLSDTNKTFAKMKHLMAEIEQDRARDWFEKRKSGLCGWCAVQSCEHHFVARPK